MLAPPNAALSSKIRRASLEDSAEVAAILNHPSVRPFLGDGEYEPVDPANLIEDPKNILLFDEGGGQFFHWRGPGVFEAHSFYLVRGKQALERGREAVQLMFAEYGAEMIWRATPVENRRARWFNRQLGFKSNGILEMPGYANGLCEIFELRNSPCH
jgi:hypothetical protein